MTSENPMLSLLGADQPDSEHIGELMLFGQFTGSWDLEAVFFENGIENRTTGEWHFDWILQGRALQDVLIFPALAPPESALTREHRIGTSLRFYDSEAEIWRVVWINPSTGTMYKLTGGRIEDEILLEGDPNDGEPTKWIFSKITRSSFLWRGLVSGDNRATWRLIQEMRARRRG
jgi:hypothetical protein